MQPRGSTAASGPALGSSACPACWDSPTGTGHGKQVNTFFVQQKHRKSGAVEEFKSVIQGKT